MATHAKTVIDQLSQHLPTYPKKNNLCTELMQQFPPFPVDSESSYKKAISILDELLKFSILKKDKVLFHADAGGLKKYTMIISNLIESYERKRYANLSQDIPPSDILKFLIDQHNLVQGDLAEDLGGQSVVSDILNGKRELNKRQIEALAKRFHVSPAVFF